MVVDCVSTLCNRIENFRGTSKVLRLDQIFIAFTGDVASRLYSEEPTHFLEDPDFAPSWSVHSHHYKLLLT